MNRAQRRQQAQVKSETFNPRSITVIHGKPPVWDALCLVLQAQPLHAVFTYGDKIYNPSGIRLPADIIEHEKIHMAQQDYSIAGAELWWGKFLRDVGFRIEQEARAYGRQYAFLCKTFLDDERRKNILSQLAKTLSGPLYKNSITLDDAKDKIEDYSGVK